MNHPAGTGHENHTCFHEAQRMMDKLVNRGAISPLLPTGVVITLWNKCLPILFILLFLQLNLSVTMVSHVHHGNSDKLVMLYGGKKRYTKNLRWDKCTPFTVMFFGLGSLKKQQIMTSSILSAWVRTQVYLVTRGTPLEPQITFSVWQKPCVRAFPVHM